MTSHNGSCFRDFWKSNSLRSLTWTDPYHNIVAFIARFAFSDIVAHPIAWLVMRTTKVSQGVSIMCSKLCLEEIPTQFAVQLVPSRHMQHGISIEIGLQRQASLVIQRQNG